MDKLNRLLESIYAASERDDFEVIARLHLDDDESIRRVDEILSRPRTSYIVGETLTGYNSLHIFTAELLEHAQGQWVWHFNDDMLMTGKGWEKQLREFPADALVQPEIHQLNESKYIRDKTSPAPCHANTPVMAALLRASNTDAVDMTIHNHFVQMGAPIRFLNGITVHHQWEGLESHAY